MAQPNVSTAKLPNICLSGVPGTGKTTLAKRLADEMPGFKVLDMGKEAETRGYREEYDEALQTWIVDEDKLVDSLVGEMESGGQVVDWIHADMWPSDGTVDLIVTVRADNTILFDRYKARGYSEKKVGENIDAEIMNTIGEENNDAFADADGTTLVELISNTDEDMDANVRRIKLWVQNWKEDQDD